MKLDTDELIANIKTINLLSNRIKEAEKELTEVSQSLANWYGFKMPTGDAQFIKRELQRILLESLGA